MPVKKKVSSSSSISTKRAKHAVEISRAIDRATRDHIVLDRNIQKCIDTYNASTQHIQTIWQDTLRDADQCLEDRESRLGELDDQIAYKVRQGKIQVDQDLAEHGVVEAKKILERHGLVAIHKDELNQLQVDLTNERSEHEESLRKAIQEVVAKEKAINASVQAKTKSDCALSLAETKADLASKNVIIESLRERIAKCEKDMEAQRELTRSVAQSASQSATNVYTNASK